MDNYIGRLLDGRYELIEVIGTGGMAVVYKARCHRLNRFVAVKVLKDEFSQDAEFRRRFNAESQAVAMLSHPNIVNVYDVSRSEHMDYIVMELIDGITLKQYMENKHILNWREALHFATQIAKALEHAHSRGIIHRDIKPHNIMILKDGSVKVADFGIARVSSAQSTLTREALGSVHYISPEQAKGGKTDYRSDLYSLGVVMYEMLAGRPPYDGESPVAVAIQHINANAVPPRQYNPEIPVGLEQITMHAMTADLDARYASATEMLYDLDEFRKSPSRTFDFTPFTAELPKETVPVKTAAERAVRAQKEPVKRSVSSAARNQRSNSAALFAGVICIVAALVAIGYFLYSFFLADLFSVTEELEVPRLIGVHVDEIERTQYDGFTVTIADWQNSDTVEQGFVISQKPTDGRMAKRGSSIEVIVSAGPATDAMRNVVNETLSNAMNILNSLRQDMNLDIQVQYEHSEIQEGVVIRTEPARDEPLRNGQKIVLYVSEGPAESRVAVPALIGKQEDEAVSLLEDRDLKYGVVYVNDETEEGTVIYQNISEGEMVPAGTTINMNVSMGPEEDEGSNLPELPGVGQLVYLPMPEGDRYVSVDVKVDGVPAESLEMVELSSVGEQGLPVTLVGEGVRVVDIYISGRLWYSFEYNFDTGEIVE